MFTTNENSSLFHIIFFGPCIISFHPDSTTGRSVGLRGRWRGFSAAQPPRRAGDLPRVVAGRSRTWSGANYAPASFLVIPSPPPSSTTAGFILPTQATRIQTYQACAVCKVASGISPSLPFYPPLPSPIPATLPSPTPFDPPLTSSTTFLLLYLLLLLLLCLVIFLLLHFILLYFDLIWSPIKLLIF